MYALETPARVWQRVKLLEKEGRDLDELPSLPNIDGFSTDGDSTTDSTQAAIASKAGKENTPQASRLRPTGDSSAKRTTSAGLRAQPAGHRNTSRQNKNATKGAGLGLGVPMPSREIVSQPSAELHDISLESPSEESSDASYETDKYLRVAPSNAYRAGRSPSPIPEVTETMDTSSEDESSSPRHYLEAQRQQNRFQSAGSARLPSLTYSAASSLPSSIRSPAQRFDEEHLVSVVGEDDEPSQEETDDDTDRIRSSPMKVTRDFGDLQTKTPVAKFQPQTPQTSSSPSAYATPRAANTSSEIERRKNHLLSTLQLTAVRSAARAKVKQGTPFPRRTAGNDSEDASSVGVASSGTESASNDLNPYPNANASLPLNNAPPARFNGAKLNNYLHTLNTHLTTENTDLINQLDQANAEIQALRASTLQAINESAEDDVAVEAHNEIDMLKALVARRDQEVDTLRTQILGQHDDSDDEHSQSSSLSLRALQKEAFTLRDQLAVVNSERDAAISGWQHRTDELLVQLEEKDREIEEIQNELDAQQEGFAEKMKRLEDELCAVMEEQEEQLNAAKAENEKLADEREAIEEDAHQQIKRVETELAQANERIQGLESRPLKQSGNAEMARQLRAAEDDKHSLERNLASRQDEVVRLNQAMEEQRQQFESQIVQLQQSARQRSVNGRAAATMDGEIQLVALQADVEQYQADLERVQRALSDTIEDGRATESRLRQELDQARQELEEQTVFRGAGSNKAVQNDAKDIEIGTLTRAKAELESRVNSLRKQVNLMMAPSDGSVLGTPDKSMPFRTILGIPTPKTPGFYLPKFSNASSIADATSASFLEQISTLERQIQELRVQLEQVNRQLDDKLSKLQRSDRDHGTTRKQLTAAKARIADLERALNKAAGLSPNSRKQLDNVQIELQQARDEALSLGQDIEVAKRRSGIANDEKMYTREEAKTLLALVDHWKARVSRESALRFALVFQKLYLTRTLQESMDRLSAVDVTLLRFGMPPATPAKRRLAPRAKLQRCLSVVRAVVRMRLAASKWSNQTAKRKAFKEAYAVTRGRPYVETM